MLTAGAGQTVPITPLGTVGTTTNGIEVITPTITVSAAGYDAGLTSININGTVGDNAIHLPLTSPPGVVFLNGLYVIGQVLVPGVNSLAYPETIASVVSADQLSFSGNNTDSLPPAFSTAGAEMTTAYPTGNVYVQNFLGGGVIGMLNPLVKISSSGIALPSGVSNDLSSDDSDDDHHHHSGM